MIKSNGKNIKWCKGCKNFRNWAALCEKGSATKCEKCRNRQRVKDLEQNVELKAKRKSLSLVEDERNGQGDSSKKRRVTSSKTDFDIMGGAGDIYNSTSMPNYYHTCLP